MAKMGFVESFNALGYSLPNNQGWWSAEREDGVCITLWQEELTAGPDGLPVMLAERFGPPEEGWVKNPANGRRMKHLKRALEEFDGYVDAVIIQGRPSGAGSVKEGDPWTRPGSKWQVTRILEDGRFEARLRKL